jgi:hypothetical protein
MGANEPCEMLSIFDDKMRILQICMHLNFFPHKIVEFCMIILFNFFFGFFSHNSGPVIIRPDSLICSAKQSCLFASLSSMPLLFAVD